MDQALIEQLVAEVMSRLVTSDEPVSKAETKTLNSQPSTINFREAIITGDLLSENVNGHRVIQIAGQAILTPSAQDWLRNSKVEVVRGETKTQTAGSARWLAVVHSPCEAVSSVLDDAGRAVSLKTEPVETAAESARRAVLDLRSGEAHGVVAFSNEAEAVACLANREACCRAAAVRTVADVKRVQNSMGCNLFAVNASGLGFFELRNLLRSAASGTPAAPNGWK